jgi:hypothetical protein
MLNESGRSQRNVRCSKGKKLIANSSGRIGGALNLPPVWHSASCNEKSGV